MGIILIGAIVIGLVILVGVGLIANENAKQASKKRIEWVSFEGGNVLVDPDEVDWSAAVSQVDDPPVTQPIVPELPRPVVKGDLQSVIDRWHGQRGEMKQ